MCPMKSKCAQLFVAGVICANCTLGFMCEHKKNELAEAFINEVPRETYCPEPTKEFVTVVASSGSSIQTPSGASLIKIQPDPIIEGNQLHYFTFKLTPGEEESE